MPYPPKIRPESLGVDALVVVEREGWHEWSLRDVAAHLGVSPNALYRHVGDREGLVVLVGAAAARELRQAIVAAGHEGDAVDRLVRMGRRYVDFAVGRPSAYEAFVRAKPGPDDPAIAAWHDCWVEVVAASATAVPDAAGALGFALWSLLHGRADLTRGPTSLVDPRSGLDESVRALVAGFRAAGPLASPVPEPEGPRT